MAGASKELSDAILINPNNIDRLTEALYDALTMPEEEQIVHISTMQETLRRYNIHHWVKIFMERLAYIKDSQKSMATKKLDDAAMQQVKNEYDKAKTRLLFLDYDGTLTGFLPDPQEARPDSALISLLSALADDPKNRLVIISGRDKQTLDRWLSHLPIDIIAEHGVWIKERNKNWGTIETLSNAWKDEIQQILELYVSRTPGSFIEEKDFSLVWHFRRVETGLGELRSRELTSHLKYLTTDKNLTVLKGDKVVEIKNAEVNKGSAARKWLRKFPHQFTMALGDDWTDEDTFKAMPEKAYTIKVGSTSSAAKFNVATYREVRAFLKKIAS